MSKLSCSIMVLAIAAIAIMPVPAQSGGAEKTVEESYLQESLETMIIKEQSLSENKAMKESALKFIKQAIDDGRQNPEIGKSLEYLALETTNVIIRTGGLGRPTNDYPEIRAQACEYLGSFPSVESKDALVKVLLGDNNPMVLTKAMQSLGKIGINDTEDVTQAIGYIVNRFDVLFPDDSLAFEAVVAIGRIAEKNNGIADPIAIKTVNKVLYGNYISKTKKMAEQVLIQLRTYQAKSK